MGTSSNLPLDSGQLGLVRQFGAIVSGAELARLLGYRNGAALRQAVHRRTLQVPTFFLPGRRGRCARTEDIVRWLQRLEGLAEELPVMR
jgi:hypothetical protein